MQNQNQVFGQAAVGASIDVAPASVLVAWTDDSGTHAADTLLHFASTANLDEVTILRVGPSANIASPKATRLAGLSLLPKLEEIYCANNSLSAVNTSQNSKLAVIDVSLNNLTTNAVNFILFWSLSLTTASTSIDLGGQTPPAPPSVGPPNGLVAKNVLIVDGWAVNTD